MRQALDWLTEHQTACGLVLAAAAGYAAWNGFQAGVSIGRFQMLRGETARAASEALGG